MAQIELEGKVKRSIGEMKPVRNLKTKLTLLPEGLDGVALINITKIIFELDGKDYDITIRGNPNLEKGDTIRVHFNPYGLGETSSNEEIDTFIKWLKNRSDFYPIKIEKIREKEIVSEFQVYGNDSTYCKEGYTPDC